MSKTILITGTSTGFGKLMSITLAKEGHTVIAGMRNVKTKNATVAAELAALPNIEVVEMDVADTTSVNTAVETVLKKHGQIDVLVNNAGIVGFGLFESFSIDRMKEVFEVNLWGTVRGYQAVLPSMRALKSGLIINISSGLGLFSLPYIVPYNMTKFGVEALTEGVRYEVKDYGIETVSVLPGPFPTEVGSPDKQHLGQGPDRQDIVNAYGTAVQGKIGEYFGIMGGKIEAYKADNQEVADAVRDLVNMKPGTRPHQTVVNRVCEGLEQEFVESREPQAKEMMNRMGFAAWMS
jgi:NAD(P)-dependent dehydrogenase (short-subunit alcohol dehydrogenase family)